MLLIRSPILKMMEFLSFGYRLDHARHARLHNARRPTPNHPHDDGHLKLVEDFHRNRVALNESRSTTWQLLEEETPRPCVALAPMRKPSYGTLLSRGPARVRATNYILARLVQHYLVPNALVTVKYPVADLRILPTVHDFIRVVDPKRCEMFESLKTVESCFVLTELIDVRPYFSGGASISTAIVDTMTSSSGRRSSPGYAPRGGC